MNKTDYNQSIALTIKSLRILKRVKQINIANALYIDQSVYCRMENGETEMTTGEVRIIASALGTSIFQVLAIVEYEYSAELSNQTPTSLAALVANYILTILNHKTIDEFSESDYRKVMKIIQRRLEMLRQH